MRAPFRFRIGLDRKPRQKFDDGDGFLPRDAAPALGLEHHVRGLEMPEPRHHRPAAL